MCNDTITVFNARYDSRHDKDYYCATVISGVSWFSEIASTVDSSGLKAANKCTVRIPTDADFRYKLYVDPGEYPVCKPDKFFTLRNGDIIVKGDAGSVNYPRPSTLQKMFPDMITILGVVDNRRAPHAPHWKVVGA